MAELIVVLGGTRSGKTAVAEGLVDGDVTYVATADVSDAGMRRRVAAHRARRPAHWSTVETADLAAAVRAADAAGDVLVDGIGAWLAGRLDGLGAFDEPARVPAATAAVANDVEELVAAVRRRSAGKVVVVAEDAGSGVVAADAGTRLWVDLLGEAVQHLSRAADRALLVHAGRAVDLPPPAVAVGHGAADALRAHGDTMVPAGAEDFAVNVHGNGPPPHLQAAITAAAEDLGRYPDTGPATAAVAARHGRSPSQALVTAGAAEAFWLLAATVKPRRAVVVHPQFTEPEAALRAHGIAVEHVMRRPEQGWALEPSVIPDDADLVVVGNPNNPTGRLDDAEAVASLCRPGRVTVVDEAFMDFVIDDVGVARRADLPGLVVVRSVTKLWGLAGLRVGYLLGPEGLVQRCGELRQPWSVSTPALAALEVCAGDEDYRRGVAVEVARRRDGLLAGLRQIARVTAWDSAANFVLVHVADGPRVHAALLERGFALRPSTFPGLSVDHLRIAVRDPRRNEALAAAFADVMAEVPA